MKNNWLGVLLGGFGAFCSSAAFSLGLGGITTESVLNEPLIAEIELINVGDLENTQILVGIGSESDYELAGVTREFFHNDLQFEVQVEGVGQPRVLVRTRGPLQDPYLNFMVQVRWPQGKLLREYTLLLDMPVFSRQDTANDTSRQTQNSAPTTAREAVAQQNRQQQTSRQQTTTSTRTTPTRSTSNAASGRDYQVASGDTLWGLAGDVSRNTGLTRHQAMLAIHERNTDAFVNGDINRLRANAVLSIPSEAQMSQRSQGQAFRDFSSLAQQAEATPIQSSTNSFRDTLNDQSSAQPGRLALSSSDDAGSAGAINAAESEAAAEDQQAANAALAASLTENAVLKEQLDAAEIEKQELADRLANLEEQIELLQEQAALPVESEDLAAVQEAAIAEAPVQEQSLEPEPPAAAPEPETLLDKIMALRYWIFGGLALIVVVALLIVLLVMRSKKSSEVEELYYEDDEYDEEAEDEGEELLTDEDYEDEFEDEYPEDEDEELDEGIDEITKKLDPEEGQADEDADTDEQDEPLVATSFEEADEDDAFESGEFEDLDEFFSDESADATNVLFGADDAEESAEETESAAEDEAVTGSNADSGSEEEESALEYSAEDLDVDAEEEEELFEHDDEDGLEFEIGELAPSEDESLEGTDDEIDLENKFDFTEPGVTDDLAPEAAEEFEESIEVHSSDMDELLVPPDDESEDDELFAGDTPDESGGDLGAELDEDFVEELDEEEEPLLEGEDEEDAPGSIMDLDEDLNLDEDMDADLGDLDLDGDDLDAEDADEEFLTKLELAEAYIEMGDLQGAKELLSEVEKDGNAEQKAAAKSLLENAKE